MAEADAVPLEPEEDKAALKDLVSDCTCPICQEVYTNPHQLSCGHTFCLRCIDKLKRKWHNSGGGSSGRGNGRTEPASGLMRLSELLSVRVGSGSGSGGDPLLCPVCRSGIDPYKQSKPDQTAGALLMALTAVKADRCRQPDCWQRPSVRCTDCAWRLCAEHHREKLDKLSAGCGSILDEAERYLLAKSGEYDRQAAALTEADVRLDELGRALSQTVQDSVDRCRGQLSQARQDGELESGELADVSRALKDDAAKLRQLLDGGDSPSLELAPQQCRQLERRLRAARLRFPPGELMLGFEDQEKLIADHASLLSGLSARLLKRPYAAAAAAAEATKLKPSLVRRTKGGEPWEIRLLGEESLLVNYKGFPTRRLHLFNRDRLVETGTVELQMSQSQFPGQVCVCNRRARILASDPKNHCVYEFDLQGRVVGQFGEKGSEPGKLHSPKGMHAHESSAVLYVVDSKNKRIQLYDLDKGSYECLGSLEHSGMSANIQAVHAGPECVVVCDRGGDNLIVFDRVSRRFLRQLPAGGEPFDVCADQFDNVIVSLTRERKVKVFDPCVTRCVATFDVAAADGGDPEPGMSASDKPLRAYLHGVAYDQAAGRLYLAEAFAKRLLGFEML